MKRDGSYREVAKFPVVRIAIAMAILVILHPLAYGPGLYLQHRQWVPPVVIETIFAPEIRFLGSGATPVLREAYASYTLSFLAWAMRDELKAEFPRLYEKSQ